MDLLLFLNFNFQLTCHFGMEFNAHSMDAQRFQAAGEKRVPETWSCETCFHYRKGKKLPICGGCEDGSRYTPMDAGQQDQDTDGEREDGSHGNE